MNGGVGLLIALHQTAMRATHLILILAMRARACFSDPIALHLNYDSGAML